MVKNATDMYYEFYFGAFSFANTEEEAYLDKNDFVFIDGESYKNAGELRLF